MGALVYCQSPIRVRWWSITIRLLAGLASTLCTFGIYASAGEPLTPHQRLLLSQGVILLDVRTEAAGRVSVVKGVIDVPVGAKTLWRVLVDCERAPKFLVGLKSCRIVSKDRSGRWDEREHRLKWHWLLPELRCIVRSHYTQHQMIRFARSRGDLKALHGRWVFKSIDRGGSTRLYYEARIDTGLQLPAKWVRNMLMTMIPQTLKAVRQEAVRVRRLTELPGIRNRDRF